MQDKNPMEFNNVGLQVVTYSDLPLSCPTAQMVLWNAHPRVYLPIEVTGREICPYCSAEYILQDFKAPEDNSEDEIR